MERIIRLLEIFASEYEGKNDCCSLMAARKYRLVIRMLRRLG